MSRVIFSEQQSFRQTVWIWLIILPVAFGISLIMMYGFYRQIVLGQPWGDKPLSDGGLIAATAGVIAIEALTVWVVASLQVSIEITPDEFRYRFFAHFAGWKTLGRANIMNYSIEKYSFWNGRGLGYRKDPFNKTTRMIINPAYILTLALDNGKTLMLSTGNKETLDRAMRRLMSNNET